MSMPPAATDAPPEAPGAAPAWGRPWHWPRPRSVAGQILLLVVAAIVATHTVAALALFVFREPWRADGRPGVAANRVAVIARILDATAPEGRAALLAAARRSVPSLRLGAWDGAGAPAGNAWVLAHPVVERLSEAYGSDLVIADLSQGAEAEDPSVLHVGLRTPHGAGLRATLPNDALGPSKQGIVVVTLLFLATTVTLLSVWATRALTAPLAQLAGAAEAFGTRSAPPPLPRRGPEEVLALAGALDRMRKRVARLLDDRTQMLAAISHDLRTPITRLRLRAEFIEDAEARERTLRDLDQMNALVEAALAYARDERGADAAPGRDRPLVEVASLVQTVCDDYSDTGADVRVERTSHALVRAQPEDLQRAVGNLVDNAVKYAGSARLRVERSAQGVAITVADDGPGIPEAERQAMLQPFVRGDRARNLDEAHGFGLGLSIVHAIVEGHAGRLTLENRPGGGLLVRIALPAAAQAAPAGMRQAAE